MAEGWIKLHRKVMDSGYYTDSFAVHLWVHLLMEASYSKKKTIFNGKVIELNEGQLITGRKKLSQETGIGEQVIRKWLDLFELNQQITIEKTNGGSCISILNYKSYQQFNQPSDDNLTSNQPATNQQPTSDQPLYKELKKGKKLKKERKKGVVFIPPQLSEVIEFFKEKGFPENLAIRAFSGYDEADWHDSKGNKVLNWKQKMINVWFKPEDKLPKINPTIGRALRQV